MGRFLHKSLPPGHQRLKLHPAGFAEAGVLAAGIGEICLVFFIKRPQCLLGGGRHFIGKQADRHAHRLDRRRLLHAFEIIPAPPGRIAGKTGLKHHQSSAGEQFRPQGFKQIALRNRHRPESQSGDNFVEFLLAYEVVGPVGEKLVDRRVTHHQPVFPAFLPDEHRADHSLFVIGKQRQLRGIPPGGDSTVHQKAVEHRPHGHAAFELVLADIAAAPVDRHWIPCRGAAAHLQEGGQHEKSEHRQNGDKNQQGTLVLAENIERTGHGGA